MNRYLMAAVVTSVALAASGCAHVQPVGMQEYVVVGSGGGGNPGEVTTYRLDRATGDLTLIEREEVGGLASYIATNPNHPVMYVTAERGGAMHWVRIDPATGMMTVEGNRAGGGNPVYASVDATGSVLLAVNYGQGTTDAFPLDPRTGAIAGAATTYPTGENSHSAVFRPDNRFVYVPAIRDSTVAQFEFRDGGLAPLTPPRLAQPGGPRHLTFHPSGDFAYAVSGPTDNVFMYRVGADGRLTSLGAVRRLPAGFTAEPGSHMGSDIHVTPSGRFAYVANRGQSNTLAIYSIGADGRLTLVGHESTGGNTPRTFALDPVGEMVVIGNQDSQTVSVFRLNGQTGGLTRLHTEEVGVSPWFVGVFRFPVN